MKTVKTMVAAGAILVFAAGLFVLSAGSDRSAGVERRDKAASDPGQSFVRSTSPPEGCPFPPSKDLVGLEFTGRHAEYTDADTWYPSWASDGKMYSPWTDGRIGAVSCDSYGDKAATGQAVIEGDDPRALKITAIGTHPGSPKPYEGRYPCGSLVFDGVWYYGTYALKNTHYGLNWPVLGPTPGFYVSKDLGRTWQDPPHTCEPGRTLFPEPSLLAGPVKIGAPHFVDFGKNMEHSPDGKAYLVGHGSEEPDLEDRPANLSWITGDRVYLCRVAPSPETINDASRYEYYGGRDAAGWPVWTKDFSLIRPLLEWDNNMGCVTITYDAPLKKYLMCVTDGVLTIWKFNTYVLEADEITGPWRMVAYLKDFGEQGYFVNFPSKFISADGRTLWLSYSANFTNGYLNTRFKSSPDGSRYAMCLQEVKLGD